MLTKKDVGMAIRNKRKKAGLRQKDLALLLNPKTRPETISRIETGNANYTIDYLFKIAEILKCDISDFFSSDHKVRSQQLIIFQGTIDDLREKLAEKK